uniref:Uncharacterized protein n=1 Tax=Aegilops tauschii subsp. strangulata TaxID=200361 RepID=A0A453GL96_AEGTS
LVNTKVNDMHAETGHADASGLGDIAIDVRILNLSETIDHQMRASSRPPPPRAQIYRVPERLHAADKDAYEPRFLSFGPYHRGDNVTEEVRRGNSSKDDDLAFALQVGGPPILEYIKYIASIEAKARSCYGGDVAMEWDEFCTMLLKVGCS